MFDADDDRKRTAREMTEPPRIVVTVQPAHVLAVAALVAVLVVCIGHHPPGETHGVVRPANRAGGGFGGATGDLGHHRTRHNKISIKVEEAEEDVDRGGGRPGSRGKSSSSNNKRVKPMIDFTAALGLEGAAGGSVEDNAMMHAVSKPKCTPVNCAGRWSGWTKCDTHCGTGAEKRRFTVTHLASCGGQACSHVHGEQQERTCIGPGTNCCPGEWGRWTPCSATCGGGVQARVYEVDFARAPGGCEAPTMQEKKCGENPCPQDCIGAWSGWSACDVVCGRGRRIRRFVVKQPAAYGGLECVVRDGKEEEQGCEGKPTSSPLCKGLSCEGHYGPWTTCSKPCMGGQQNRTFIVTRPAAPGGGRCEVENGHVDVRSCNDKPCPRPTDCRGKWEGWSKCSHPCGGGSRTRKYKVLEHEVAGGTCDLRDAKETADCNLHPCPVDCHGGFGPWSECTQACGGGLTHREYQVLVEAAHGGKMCPHAAGDREQKLCNTERCAVNCVGNFTEWSGTCPECGVAAPVVRTFEVLRPAKDGGRECDFKDGYAQTQRCPYRPCSADCVGSFTKWSPCSRKCGGGTRRRRYTVVSDAAAGGKECAMKNGEIEVGECNTQPCPVNCEGEWRVDGTCDRSCQRTKRFAVTKEAAHGGRHCDIADGEEQTEMCSHEECGYDCEGAWDEWGECSAPCDPKAGGVSTRTFKVTSLAVGGGAQCEHNDGDVDTKPCNRHVCPTNCVGKWGKWSSCTLKCGGGSRQRRYHIEKGNSAAGHDCPFAQNEVQEEECNVNPCPCAGFWGPWSECDGGCPRSVQTRQFTVVKEADHGGSCEAVHGQIQRRTCGNVENTCDVDCVGKFSDWSKCSADCGGGTQRRVFTISVIQRGMGKACEKEANEIEERVCNTNRCRTDCEGTWTTWTECTKKCGGGTQHRFFQLQKEADGGGHCEYVDHEKQTRPCNENACVRDCVGGWGKWGKCEANDAEAGCGEGTRTKRYHVKNEADHGGRPCGIPHGQTVQEPCFAGECGINCVGEWSDWGECSQRCAKPWAVQKRTYEVLTPGGGPGAAACEEEDGKVEERPCNQDVPCGSVNEHNSDSNEDSAGRDEVKSAVEQAVAARLAPATRCPGQWSKWSACSKPCGGGKKSRRFHLPHTAAADATAHCAATNGEVQEMPCNDRPCVVSDCEGGWGEWSECSNACGTGEKSRTYTVFKPAGHGGTDCPHQAGEVQTIACRGPLCDGGAEDEDAHGAGDTSSYAEPI